jgi:hypothetical protein
VIEPSDEQPQELSAAQREALRETGRWVRSAQRQEKRLQDAWVRYVEVRSRYPDSVLDQIPGVVPADLHDADERLADELHYLLIAAHQALRTGPQYVRKLGLSLHKAETSFVVAKLRDVLEHWDQSLGPVTGQPEDLRRWTKDKRSGKKLAEVYPRTWFPQSAGGDESHLDVIAGVLKMRELLRDLELERWAVRRWFSLDSPPEFVLWRGS